MREGWESFKLKEVCEIRPPKRESKEILSEDDLVSFVPMSHLNEERKDFHEEEAKPLKSVYKGYTYFKDEDVLLAKITPCFENCKMGIAKGLTNGVGFGSSEFIVYRTDFRLISEYLFYFLLLPKFRAQGVKMMGGAVGHQRIPKEFYEDYEIPIPPLPEQKRIVAILDEAFEAIDKAKANIERNIQNAEELFQSKLNEIFSQRGEGWVSNKLKDITTKIGSGATPRGGKKNYKKSGISLIRSLNVYDDGFEEEKLAFIDEEQAEKLSIVELFEGDVLLNITGASVARCCVVPKDFLPARVNQHVSIIRLAEGVMNEHFLHYLLISKPYKDKLLGIGEQGATRQAITKSQIQDFKVSYPNEINEQKKLIDILDDYRDLSITLKDRYEAKLLSLEELKKSILQKAFSGELTGGESGFMGLKDLQDKIVNKAAEVETEYEVR